ncbi:MAG: PEP-CTERM sorting domain-containing protein [Phycisphaerales bacterium]
MMMNTKKSETMSRARRACWGAGAVALAVCGTAAAGSGNNDQLVTFDDGNQGWSLLGHSTVSPAGGNPGARIHWDDFIDNFGMSARNSTNANFIGDYTAKGPVTLSIDWKVDYMSFFGSPVSRTLVVQLFDDDPFEGAPPASVWMELGTLPSSTNGNWLTFQATVDDVLGEALPSGWNGAGDEDPNTFEPILPDGRTWTNVLQGVDRIEFTTFVPGFFYGFTNFNVSIDNVSITPVPGAGAMGVFGVCGLAAARRRRR